MAGVCVTPANRTSRRLTKWTDSLGELVLEEVGVRDIVLDPKVEDPLRLPALRVLAGTRFQWV